MWTDTQRYPFELLVCLVVYSLLVGAVLYFGQRRLQQCIIRLELRMDLHERDVEGAVRAEQPPFNAYGDPSAYCGAGVHLSWRSFYPSQSLAKSVFLVPPLFTSISPSGITVDARLPSNVA